MKLLKPTMPMLRNALPMLNHDAVPGTKVARPSGQQVQALRRRLYARSGGMCECEMCAASGHPIKLTLSTAQVDHRTPIAMGGGNEIGNLRILDPQCHAAITAQQQGQWQSRSWGDTADIGQSSSTTREDWDICG